ncbi:MAG TPA: hypothetical protein VH301_15670 [Usitatibacter sp.]|jgi:hypothetical protein|nr:hypothetical protein [Usitatibacter sp.]
MRKLALTAALALPALAVALPAAGEGFGPVHVAVNRHEHHGACPVEIVFTASINFTMPHPKGFTFSYHWERSDGAKGKSHVVKPGPHEHTLVVHDKWKVGGHHSTHDVSETIHLGSGNERMTESSPTVHIECR